MPQSLRVGVILALLLAACGCTSIAGQSRPVISVATADSVLASYQVPAVLEAYQGKHGRAQRLYRDEVIAAYLQAIDARYFVFRGKLGSEARTTQLGFDTVIIGLAGAATLAPKAAGDLAAVSSGVIGLRGSVDRNVYFDRTLPALLATMDAGRLKVRTRVAEGQAKSTGEYPLNVALRDLQDYERAGTLYEAIGSLTNVALESRQHAEAAYEARAKFTCDPDDTVNVAANPIGTFKRQLYAAAEGEAQARTGALTEYNKLATLASAFKINPAGKTVEQLEAAIDDAFLGGFCSVAEIDVLKANLRTLNVGFN